jgi:predicted RNA-binding protein with TRAM domain
MTPVKENQELEVVIDDIGSRGDGIARIQGYLIFVPNSKIGERVKVRILVSWRKIRRRGKNRLKWEDKS